MFANTHGEHSLYDDDEIRFQLFEYKTEKNFNQRSRIIKKAVYLLVASGKSNANAYFIAK